jgi:hypothetical protein
MFSEIQVGSKILPIDVFYLTGDAWMSHKVFFSPKVIWPKKRILKICCSSINGKKIGNLSIYVSEEEKS